MNVSEVTEKKSWEPGAKDLSSNPLSASYFLNLGKASSSSVALSFSICNEPSSQESRVVEMR